MFCGLYAPACAGAWNYEFARAHGVSSSGALQTAVISAATTYAFQQIGKSFSDVGATNIDKLINGADFSVKSFGGNLLTSSQAAAQISAHAIIGGISAELSGGKFGHGFISAGVTKGAGGIFLPGGSNLSSSQVVGGTVISAVIGGTMSSLTGGKFANGAKTAAMQYLFNQASQTIGRMARAQRIRNQGMARSGAQQIQLVVGASQIMIGSAACVTGVGCYKGGGLILLGVRDMNEALTGNDVIVVMLQSERVGLSATEARAGALMLDAGLMFLPLGGNMVKVGTGDMTRLDYVVDTSLTVGGGVDFFNDLDELADSKND